jgi:hypothetical protein
MNCESTIISFEKLQSKQREKSKNSSNRIFVQIRSVFIEGVRERLGRFFTKIDDELFCLSEKADNCVLQARYFNDMRYLRSNREALQERYLSELTGFFEGFWRGKPLPGLGRESTDLGELALLENEILEENLAINGMIEKGNNLFQKELYALNRRFMALLGNPEVAIGVNPVAPLVLCRMFALVINGLTLELKLKLLIYKIFDRQILSSFGAIYHDMNAQMVKAGVRPSLVKSGHARRSRTDDTTLPLVPGKEKKPECDGSAVVPPADAFAVMRRLLDARRCRSGASGLPPNSDNDTDLTNSTGVLSALGLLQRPSRISTNSGAILSGEQMKRLIAQQMEILRPDGGALLLDRQVEDTIDMVGMIFVYILEDRHLPDSIKAMLANLQIPILKIALMESSFFAKKNHPARLLLNSLAQAGMGLDSGTEADSPVYHKIQAVVEQILVNWSRNAVLFFELLEDFTAFMAIEYRRNRAAEERTRQATQSKEQVRHAKRAVAHVIAWRLHCVSTPLILKSFLYNAWKDVMVIAWLRRNKDAEDWNSAICLMDQLINDICCTNGSQTLGQGKQQETPLMEAMKIRLESLAYEQHWIMELLKELEVCYGDHLQGVMMESQPNVNLILSEKIEIIDSDFATILGEIETAMQKGGNLGQATAVLPLSIKVGGAISYSQERVDTLGNGDEFVCKASALGVGQWVEFAEAQCKLRRAKLSWKSQENDMHIFVNAKGAKIIEMNLQDLARCFRTGNAKIIEDSSVPLMDRALSRLLLDLENPACAFVP